MMRSIGILVGAVVLLALGAVGLDAQSLLDNGFYNKAVAQKQQSEQAYQNGDYDVAASLAKESQDNFEKSDAYVQKKMEFYRANGWLFRANERLAYAKDIKADVNFKSAFAAASRDVADAKTMLDTEEYVKSVDLSKKAISALQNIREITAPAPATVTPAEPQAPPLPSSYTVRLIMARRDCFWRIAGYPFVYNDPWKWKTLYEANKSILEDPNNADLIQPGQVFTIPSLQGEERDGEYDPEKSYTPLSVK